ncbi:MAG: dephospho-CoA kinase [Oscillospiraceae bacterium]|jgi:dephospho-CoA kinase
MGCYVFALTGMSGSGKSLAASYLREKGFYVIDSDEVVRKVEEPGTECTEKLMKVFPEAYSKSGVLDRKKLAELCFGNSENLKKLNSIVHPYVAEEVKKEIRKIGEEGEKFCFLEAPALFESGLDSICDLIILVTSDRETMKKRIMERDGLTEEEAERRLSSQTSQEDAMDRADLTIMNNGSEENFKKSIDGMCRYLAIWITNKEK